MKSCLSIFTTVACTFLLTFTSMTSSEAQTREETIAWLQSKFSIPGIAEYDYRIGNLVWNEGYLKKLDECRFVIGFKYREEDDHYWWILTRIPLKNIRNSDGYLVIDFPGIDLKYFRVRNSDGSDFPPAYSVDVSSHTSIRILDKEPNLAERIVKALNHLATFCPQNEPEKF